MPLFEYVCEDCGTNFEKLVRSSNNSAILCPSCNGQNVRKKLSAFVAKVSGGSSSSCASCSTTSCSTST